MRTQTRGTRPPLLLPPRSNGAPLSRRDVQGPALCGVWHRSPARRFPKGPLSSACLPALSRAVPCTRGVLRGYLDIESGPRFVQRLQRAVGLRCSPTCGHMAAAIDTRCEGGGTTTPTTSVAYRLRDWKLANGLLARLLLLLGGRAPFRFAGATKAGLQRRVWDAAQGRGQCVTCCATVLYSTVDVWMGE